MINFHGVTKGEIKEHDRNWPEVPDHQYRILTISDSGSEKTNSLFNLINQQPLIKFIYMLKIHMKYQQQNIKIAKYQFLINKRESFLKILNLLFNNSNDMDDIYKTIEKYNPNKRRKILIVFGDMIADMLSNKNLNQIVIESFIRGRWLNISLVFITKFYFAVPKNIRLNSTH